ncbi:metallophosphoesterase family protein [Sporosarcina sp. ANT_H38]|uniref:metallophosphoesterase family protein n=1 Tax=Sporosarcina sp. ANT_H38 TaxID=2597358 RepID=UPI0011F2588F|nr:metallophosphoesterase family protein [Sporosarcina sp. ANT_H38]KAA0966782.1 metallophosphoesterase family protein [Sporosarcina sp. ANT_H38]
MRIGILSDIHGNIDALNAVLKHAEKLKVETFFILGDLVGYYLDPEKVIQRIRTLSNTTTIQGNHERFLIQVLNGTKDIHELNNKYGEGHQLALQKLNAGELDWLAELPIEKNMMFDGLSIKLCHGAPGHPDMYLYPDTKKEIMIELFNEEHDFIFVGHSHYPFIIPRNNCVLINVGSVGMSKDVGGLASWGLLDTSNRTFIPHRTPYNTDRLANAITNSENLNSDYLVSLLTRNRYDK